MKKVLGVLVALLMATSALANVTMTITEAEMDNNKRWVDIDYNAAGEPNLPRAFALRIDVDAGSMDAVQFKAGTGDEACASCEDFKIHPGNIQIDGAGNVVSWGRPVAPGNAPDNPPQLPSTTYVIVEMGSLYRKGIDPAPPVSGLLIRVRVTASCTMTVSEEATVRGGVVLEDPDVIFDFVGDSESIFVPPPEPACWNYQSICYGDAQTDGDVDGFDFILWKNAWFGSNPNWNDPHGTADGEYNPCADFQRDGDVDGMDFIQWKNTFTGATPYDTNCVALHGIKPWPPAGYP